ncbi:MAG TPA: GvpL/GvpF family gas vesicle protein, partial [Pyrinomonadaceae bacterium]|nr:GvpL/GvpF family gas vesicle protein [Pyrinomonadaceae bacterium]
GSCAVERHGRRSALSLYAYCLCAELRPDALDEVAGIAGAQVRVLWCDEIAAVVSEFEGDAVKVTRAHVLAHERVVGCVLRQVTPLPFRFGTLTSETRLRSYIETNESALRARLARVRGCVEMSVKVMWRRESDEQTDVRAAQVEFNAHTSARDMKGTGTAFLEAKRRALVSDETAQAQAEEIARWLTGQLADVVRAEQMSVRPSAALVISAAHLVERARLAEYRERVRRVFAGRGELHFLTSGPWPPYSFSQENP